MNLYKTAAIVTIFAAIEHGLGFLYRIILSRMLGPEGLGIYQLALSVFSVFLTVCASGLPITLSRIISKHRAEGHPARAHRATAAAVLLSASFSLALTALLFMLRGVFSGIFADPRCADLFYILLLGLSCTSVYAVLRGSFWGNKRFFAYSLIELLEEIVMIVSGVLLLLFAGGGVGNVNKAGAAVVISYLASFSIALFYFFWKGGKMRSPRGEIKPLVCAALPVTMMRTCSSLTSSLISVVFPMRLIAAGYTRARAMSAYGIVGGMVMPVLTIPCSLIGSIALVLVPELSESYYRGDREKLSALVKKAIDVTLLIAGLLVPFFIACGEGAGIFLYANAESGKLIARSALILFPLSVTMISTSLLNSMNCEKYTLLFFLFGAGAMLLCVWVLPARLGAGALLVGMAADHTVTAACSLLLLAKKTKLRSGKYFLRLTLAVCIAAALGLGLQSIFLQFFNYIPALLLTALGVGLAEVLLFPLLHLFDLSALFRKFLPRRKKPLRHGLSRDSSPARGAKGRP